MHDVFLARLRKFAFICFHLVGIGLAMLERYSKSEIFRLETGQSQDCE
jgi:hypothetical protein